MLARLLLAGGLVLLQLGAAQQLEEIEAQIEALYKEHNPDKVDKIPGLLEKYKGSETKLLKTIQEKYGVESEEQQPPPPPSYWAPWRRRRRS